MNLLYYAQPLESRRLHAVTSDGLPDLLTVDEAAAILRIGRTKAYDLARQWRATNGATGLPVLDFGNVLRVPRHALEKLVGGELRSAPALRVVDSERTDDEAQADEPAPAPENHPRQRPSRRPGPRSTSQLDLFTPPAAS